MARRTYPRTYPSIEKQQPSITLSQACAGHFRFAPTAKESIPAEIGSFNSTHGRRSFLIAQIPTSIRG